LGLFGGRVLSLPEPTWLLTFGLLLVVIVVGLVVVGLGVVEAPVFPVALRGNLRGKMRVVVLGGSGLGGRREGIVMTCQSL